MLSIFSDENRDITEIEIDEFYKKIGRKVKEARMSKKLTQLELSFAMEYKSVSLVSVAEVYKNKKHFNLLHTYIKSQKF